MSWFTRKAISLATVYLAIKQYTDDEGKTHIDIDQTATGGIKGTAELRTLDWTNRTHVDHIFGELEAKSRWTELDVVTDEFLKAEWLTGDEEKGGPKGEKFVQNYVVNASSGWTGEQIWGFAIIDGTRYYTRRVVIIKGDTTLKVRLVYDFKGKE